MYAMQSRWPQHRVVPSVQPHGDLTSYCSLNFRNFLDINQFGCRVCRSRLQPSAHHQVTQEPLQHYPSTHP